MRALETRAGAAAGRARLVSTYYDTPELALARQGMALRVRAKGGKFVQTVKSGDGASRIVRGEWEDRIRGAEPDPDAAESGRFLSPEIAPRLTPLFRTEVDRRTVGLSPAPGIEVEAAIDRGWIHAVGREGGERVSEVELELKSGEPAALYDVALDLLRVAPLRLVPRSKSDRGYRLVAGLADAAAPAHRAAADLDPALSGGEALRRIGDACLGQILDNEAAVLAGDPEGVHQMRVAVRRLRALLSAFGHLLPGDERRSVSHELRWLADTLGPARNLDVFAALVLATPPEATSDPHGLAALSAALEQRRRVAFAKAAWLVRSRRFTALMLRQRRWFDSATWRDGAVAELGRPIASLAGPILRRCRRKAKRRTRHFASQSERARHQLRIACKKLRYASEMLAPLYPLDAVGDFVKPLKRLQDDLGDANDLRVARAILTTLSRASGADPVIAEAGERVIAWHKHRLARRGPRVGEHLDQLFDTVPFWDR